MPCSRSKFEIGLSWDPLISRLPKNCKYPDGDFIYLGRGINQYVPKFMGIFYINNISKGIQGLLIP